MDPRNGLVALTLLGLVLGTARAQPPAPVAAAPAPAAQAPAPTAEASAPTAATPAPRSASVQLLPGDEVKMEMFGHPEITTQTYVESSGALDLPLIGPVKVGGLSPREASKQVEAAYESGKYFKRPEVNLTVMRSLGRVSVLGEVKRQNRYPIEANATVLDVLALAGDRTAKGGDVVVVLRRDASGNTQHINVDLKSIPSPDEKVPAAALVTLQNGDVIYVPPAPQCFVVGEVRKPDGYRLEKGMTVERAIALAGGVTAIGDANKVEIERRQASGDYAILRGQPADSVQADDIITVKQRLF